MKKNFFLFGIIVIFIPLFIISFNIFDSQRVIFKNLSTEIQIIIRTVRKGESLKKGLSNLVDSVVNDYNVKYLPDSQFTRLDLKKKKINFEEKKGKYFSFYIEIMDNRIWIIDHLGNFLEIDIEEIKDEEPSELKTKKINNNLSVNKIIGTLIHDEKIYIAYKKINNNCVTLNISSAEINSKFLDFKNFFNSSECGKGSFGGGRMQFFVHKGTEGLILSTSDWLTGDKYDERPQNDESIFGKILFIDFNKKNHIIFSKGHRNSIGLYSRGNLILSTDHGPRGGDEINKVIFGKNYGWEKASYGEIYGHGKNEKSNEPVYLKSHIELGFEEPIFAFVPSIGISQIIEIPNSFSNFWSNNFLVSSLFGRSLYRVKFDENYNKVIYYEKIFVGERIRDLKYLKKNDSILFAFEEEGELGIMKVLND